MNINELLSIQSWPEKIAELKSFTAAREKTRFREYYDGKHNVLTDPDRQDINVEMFKKDEITGEKKANGVKTVQKTKKVLNYPVQLIGTLASFVFGNPPELILNDKNPSDDQTAAYQRIKDVWARESRLDEHNKRLLRTVSVETNAAELFFNDNPLSPKNGKIKVLLLSEENGDEFSPFFNDNRDMEAFIRRYSKREVIDGAVTTKIYEEIWTAEKYILLDVTEGNADSPIKDIPNPYGKIPVVYYDQKYPEWRKVENLIDIIEKKESQLSDVNTRVGHAAVKITGDLVNMPDASADVKVYQVKPSQGSDGKTVIGDVSYMESQTAPESVKLELDRTDGEIYKFSNIPDLYEIFKNATNESGKALKIRLFPINIIIDEKKEIYSPGLDRRVSVLKTMLYLITGQNVYRDLDISVNFRDYIPEDMATIIADLMTANGNKPILSQQRSVSLFPLNKNPSEEWESINSETAKSNAEAGAVIPDPTLEPYGKKKKDNSPVK